MGMEGVGEPRLTAAVSSPLGAADSRYVAKESMWLETKAVFSHIPHPPTPNPLSKWLSQT